MLTVTGGADSIIALQNGAYQEAEITIYDAFTSGHPQLAQLTNDDILSNTLTLERSCSESGYIELGGLIADELHFTARAGTLSGVLVNQIITVSISWAYDSSHTDTLYVFDGVITEAKAVKGGYAITALDASVVFDKPYKVANLHDPRHPANPLTYPVTVLKLAQSIIMDIGAPYVDTHILLQTATPVNTSVQITGVPEDKKYTYRQVLRWCAQLMGVSMRTKSAPSSPVELWSYDSPTSSTILDAIRVSPAKAYSISMDRTDIVFDGCDIVYGNQMLYEPSGTDNARVHLTDNALIERLYNELDTITYQNIVSNIDTSIRNHLSATPPGGYQVSDCRCLAMWYLEPGDIIQLADPSTNWSSYRLVAILSVTHKLNGATTFKSNVNAPLPEEEGIQAFSGQQQNDLLSREQRLDNQITALADRVTGISDDYIVDHGTDGIWTYRKWASGVAECWGTKSDTVTMSTLGSQYGIGGLFYNSTNNSSWDISFPTSLFVNTPVVTGTVNSGTNTLVSFGTVSDAHVLPRFWTPFTGGTAVSINLKIYAAGRWTT